MKYMEIVYKYTHKDTLRYYHNLNKAELKKFHNKNYLIYDQKDNNLEFLEIRKILIIIFYGINGERILKKCLEL